MRKCAATITAFLITFMPYIPEARAELTVAVKYSVPWYVVPLTVVSMGALGWYLNESDRPKGAVIGVAAAGVGMLVMIPIPDL